MTKRKRKAEAPSSRSGRVKRAIHSSSTAESVADGSSVGSRKIVAFLRGVNVGGRVHSMKSIAEALRTIGFHNVETFLASGNVISMHLLTRKETHPQY
ncbi:hypothetical protein DVH05_001714 [Phytophthora capsici]|nr:hypothetical protein DVH05_001714 [Phytophthora capsici]